MEHIGLKFGTSGLRDRVEKMTDRECWLNTRGFIEFLKERGEVSPGAAIALGGDLRPSTPRIMAAVGRAIADSGCRTAGCGLLPTPALAAYAFSRKIPSVMVTGSHIPAGRNGIKFTKKTGEVLKSDEEDILTAVAGVRTEEENQNKPGILFDTQGAFRIPPPAVGDDYAEEARSAYIRRYLDTFPAGCLSGIRLVFYQHSAVGRDLIKAVFEGLGAEVIAAGRSEDFVPVDTEKVSAETRSYLRELARKHRPFAVISTDGDSDRPLLADENGKFLPGDILGALASLYLGPDAVALPVSSNDAVIGALEKNGVRVRLTRIGSPYVIAAMNELRKKNPDSLVAGWEVNGGYLTDSD